ncbi:MAG: hypothetical protein HRU38_11115 [Saccharospirillaceae bacterium]|nr:peptidoglycan binding protein CsiV [Pseudomonadales bacterium]NRB79203.1 hypothetical protein [Saccharospirillaceae bacterium]
MIKLFKLTKTTKLLFAMILLPAISMVSFAAQNKNSGRWYQVEMIVFKNQAIKQTHPESFEITIQPSKPSSYETLIPSQNKEISFLELDFSLLSQTDLDIQQLINNESFTYEQAVQFFGSTHDVSTLLPKPYVLIESENNALTPHYKSLKNSRNMHVIGYQVWQQPIWDKAVASSIELNFGKQFNGQYEISGWLNLTISRYIHVNPQMYINKFEQLNDTNYQALQFESPLSYALDSKDLDTKSKFSAPNPYRLVSSIEINETKKTASKKVLYIDHPELAFLFYFTPIETGL